MAIPDGQLYHDGALGDFFNTNYKWHLFFTN